MSTAGQPDPRFTDVGRLVVRCPDRPGIVAVLSRLMADVGANIIDSQQHSSDPQRRHVHAAAGVRAGRPGRRRRAAAGGRAGRAGAAVGMTWRLTEAAHRPTLAVFVSKTDHVLQELHLPGAGRRPAGRDRLRRLQPPRPGAGGARRRHPVPPRAGDAGDQGRGRGAGAGADRRRRPGGARPLHADRVARLLRPVPGAADQHPPQLPAGVRRREPVPGGARPRA